MDNKLKYTIIGLASIGTAVIGRYLYVNFVRLKNWDFQYNGIIPKDVSFVNNKPKISGEVSITFLNKSDITATIKDIDVQAFAKGVRLGAVNRATPLTIMPSSGTNVVFGVNFDTDEIVNQWNVLLGTALQTKNIPLDFVGQFKMKVLGGWIKIPVKYSTTGKDLKKMYDTYYG